MPELVEPSDVSSSELSDVEKTSTSRGAAPVELTDLPTLVPNTGDPEERAKEDLNEFWQSNPINELDFEGLNEEQLLAVSKWMHELRENFDAKLKTLRQELQAEWLAKERALDQLLQASIGDSLSVE